MQSILIASLLLIVAAAPAGAGDDFGDVTLPARFARARTFLSADTVNDLLAEQPTAAWTPAVNPEKARGSGRAIFAKVAPAVVVVRTTVGHGTGIVISPQGRILTNHHVVESGSLLDVERGASWAHVHLGRPSKSDGMQLREEPVKAYLLAVDAVRDLALLEIAALPDGVRELPHLELAGDLPAVGETCAIVGHPASGLLWTYRSGEVAAIGRSPDDLIEIVMPRLVAARDQRAEIETQLARLPKRRIVLTSCGANSGDSGGPLVDEDGDVIGVTFAIPTDAHARWSYHVHVDEVRAFLASAGRQPILLAPDGWQIGRNVELVDLLETGRPQAIVAGRERPEQVLLDLDGDTPEELLRSEDFDALIRRRQFDAEAALHADASARRSFYDTDADDTFDLVLEDADRDGRAEVEYTRRPDGAWSARRDGKGPWVDPDRLRKPALSQALRRAVRALR